MSVYTHYALGPLTWFRTGGIVKKFIKAQSEKELSDFLEINKEPYFVLGNGSNLLIREGIIEDTAIKLAKNFYLHERNNNEIVLGAACLNRSAVDLCLHLGLSGLEFLVGIPGSIGGAVAMNAGAIGHETKDFLKGVTVMLSSGRVVCLSTKDLSMQYRKCVLPEGAIVLNATFSLFPESEEFIQQKIDRCLEHRNQAQPVGVKTAGSTFKNPEGHKAWDLIDRAGLRGYRIGDAQFSPKHCNFIINLGNATSKDVEQLGELARKLVQQKFNIELEWEIKIYGGR